jgi:predicted Zn-dependent peptidase
VAKINAVTTDDVCRAASRLFRGAPTLATMGPAERVPQLADIADKLAA